MAMHATSAKLTAGQGQLPSSALTVYWTIITIALRRSQLAWSARTSNSLASSLSRALSGRAGPTCARCVLHVTNQTRENNEW